MSTLDVVAEILREVAPRALKARQIAELAAAAGRLTTTSRTPETVISRDLAIDVRDRGASSRFLRVDRGEFVLKEALSTAFYNDVDSYAAAWIRNLSAAGQIAPGVVDERSIRDLKPADVACYRQFHAFAGIAVWSRALRDAGWPDDVNIWSGSCPCTDFSDAGRRRGFEGDSHFWPDWFRLIAACRPSCVIGEQVSSKAGGAWLDLVFHDMEGAGYTCHALDTPACSVGAPHRRARFYFVAYLRERGHEIITAPWIHARGQAGDGSIGMGVASSSRHEGTAQLEARGISVLEHDGALDGYTSSVPDAERVVRDAGWIHQPHGRAEVEPDRHGEADGGGDHGDGSIGMGDAGLARGWRDAGEVPRAEGAGEGEWIEARDLPDELGAPSADDGGGSGEIRVVRGAATSTGDFRPGDRIRIDGDPTWGGAVRGFWAEDVEWVYCRPEPGHKDGRWRPAQRGIEPLAFRSSTDLGRTRAKRLKAYGNAIVLSHAVAFVSSVIDAFADAALAKSATASPADSPAELATIEAAPSTVEQEPLEVAPVQPTTLPWQWTGPREGETAPSGMLYGRVPGERWPYGPPSFHQSGCNLFPRRGSPGGLFCDCAASAADGVENGACA